VSRSVTRRAGRRLDRDLLLVAGIALLVRAVYWLLYSRTPFFHTPVVDASFFDLWARALAAGQTFQADVFFKPPLYPYLLAGLYGLFGRSLPLVYGLQSLLGIGTCLLTLRIGQRVLGPRPGLAAGIVTALLPLLPFFELQLLAETVTTFLTLAAVLLLLPDGSDRRPGGGRVAAAGLLLGIAALGRPNLLLAVVAVAGWLAWDDGRGRRAWRPALALLVAAAVAVLPATLHNLRYDRSPVLVSANLGANLVTGNSDTADGVSAIPVGVAWDDLQLRCRRAGQGRAAAASRYLTGEAMRWIADHPGRFLQLLGKKIVVLLGGWEVRNNIRPRLLADEFGVFPLHRWWPGTWLLLPPAIVGLAWSRRWGRRGALLTTLVVAQAVSVLPFFVNARFRMPLLPLLAVWAVAGVLLLRDRWREGGARAAAAPAAVALALLVGGNVDWFGLDAPSRSARDHFNLALIALRGDGRPVDTAAARWHFRRALELDPRDVDAHERYGAFLLQQAQPAVAAAEKEWRAGRWQQGLRQAEPAAATLEEALRQHRAAVRLLPRSYRSHGNAGIALLWLGEIEAARSQLALAGGDTAAARRTALAALDRLEEAGSELRAALRIDPSFREAVGNLRAVADAFAMLPPLDPRLERARAEAAGGQERGEGGR